MIILVGLLVGSMMQPASTGGIVATALGFIGEPYRYGGTGEGGIDCSALTQRVFADHGIALPRTADDQALVGQTIQRRQIRPGDLLFFTNHPGTGRIEHVALAVDGHHMVHALRSGSGSCSSISTPTTIVAASCSFGECWRRHARIRFRRFCGATGRRPAKVA